MDAIDKIGDTLVKDMPVAQPHVIDQTETQSPVPMDKDNKPFDPAVHLADKDGKPRLRKDGTFRNKPGRVAGKDYSRVVDVSQVPANPGTAIAETIFAMGQMIGGEDFIPINDANTGVNERAVMRSAWEAYCEQQGISDFPPGIAVTVAVIGYVIPRFFMEKTKSRFTRLKEWTATRYLNWKEKRAA